MMNDADPKKIITRFAPSPTGNLHVGNYRTGLFAYLFARQHGGSFLLRIEDTDKERSSKEYEDNIIEALEWLGLSYDGLERQSERAGVHRVYLEKMIAEGKAYLSKEAPKEEGQRSEVIRFKNPNTKVVFQDLIRGKIEMDTADLKDFVIAKSLDEPIFHLAVVADDFDMGITHVIRGDDHISNTPRQILIQQAIGAPTPVYAHLPIVLALDRSKLSKRKGALPVTEYRDRGYLASAVVNYMALIGWNPGTDQEIFNAEELLKVFDISRVQKGGAIADDTKLLWINKEHMKKLSAGDFKKGVLKYFPERFKTLPDFDRKIEGLLPLLREKLSYFGEIGHMDENGEIEYFFTEPSFPKEMLVCAEKMRKGKEVDLKKISSILQRVSGLLSTLKGEEKGATASEWTAEHIKNTVWPYADEEGKGIVLWAYRVALSGKERSPDPFVLSHILGKEETLKRLERTGASSI